jgi:hypothetical protein
MFSPSVAVLQADDRSFIVLPVLFLFEAVADFCYSEAALRFVVLLFRIARCIRSLFSCLGRTLQHLFLLLSFLPPYCIISFFPLHFVLASFYHDFINFSFPLCLFSFSLPPLVFPSLFFCKLIFFPCCSHCYSFRIALFYYFKSEN